jgi:hypothetical protein
VTMEIPYLRPFLVGMVVCNAVILIVMPAQILDLRIYYDALQAKTYILGLSEFEHTRYVLTEVLDLFFIFLYTSVFWLVVNSTESKLKQRIHLVFVPGLIDLTETLLILMALLVNISDPIYEWLGRITFAKWISVGVFFCALVMTMSHHRFKKVK